MSMATPTEGYNFQRSEQAKYNFKDGDRIRDSYGRTGTYDSTGPYCIIIGSPQESEHPGYKRFMCANDWELDPTVMQPEPWGETSLAYPVQPEAAHESDWSYAEAERLQKRAHEAIDAYNEYINAKPNTVFLTIFK